MRLKSSDTRKEIEIDDISRDTDTRRKHEILGPDDQKSNQGCLGDVPQVQTRAEFEKLPAQSSTPAIRRSGNPDDVLRFRNMDTHKRARKNDSIDATQNAPTHHTNEKEIQKDRKTKRRDQRNKRPTKKLTRQCLKKQHWIESGKIPTKE